MRKIPGADSIAIQRVGTCVHQIANEQSMVIRNLVLSPQEVLGLGGFVCFQLGKSDHTPSTLLMHMSLNCCHLDKDATLKNE